MDFESLPRLVLQDSTSSRKGKDDEEGEEKEEEEKSDDEELECEEGEAVSRQGREESKGMQDSKGKGS